MYKDVNKQRYLDSNDAHLAAGVCKQVDHLALLFLQETALLGPARARPLQRVHVQEHFRSVASLNVVPTLQATI